MTNSAPSPLDVDGRLAIEQRDALRLAVADALAELLDERLHLPGVRGLAAQVVEERSEHVGVALAKALPAVDLDRLEIRDLVVGPLDLVLDALGVVVGPALLGRVRIEGRDAGARSPRSCGRPATSAGIWPTRPTIDPSLDSAT